MPSDTVDELGIQFGNLGIGFGDTNESLGAALEVQQVGAAQQVLCSAGYLSCDCHMLRSPKPLKGFHASRHCRLAAPPRCPPQSQWMSKYLLNVLLPW